MSHTDKYKDTRSLTHAYTRKQSQYPIQAFVWQDKRAERERQRERQRGRRTDRRRRRARDRHRRRGRESHTHTHA